MRIAALSDFHIGARPSSDGWRHELTTFERFLDRLEASYERIILLGDIYQTDHGIIPTDAAARRMLDQVRRRMPSLCARFDRLPYIHVWGNHDAIAGPVLGSPERIYVSGCFPALLIHGHQFDPIAVHTPRLADAGTWVSGRLRALGLRPIASWLEHRDVAIKDRRFGGATGSYARGAEALVREHSVSIVVMGHTHCPGLIRLAAGGVLANTGTCSDGRTMWVGLDTHRGTVEIHRGRQVEHHTCTD